MASKKGVVKSKLLATLVTGKKAPCAFCRREIDDEIIYGKLYAIGDIQVHYFCALLSCCLVQKGRDTEGLFGFLYQDILAEVDRSKKHKCSYCGTGGAGLGCCVSQCRKQFHLPCGREKNAVSLFYGNYKSYCQQHAPKQKIPDHIMEPARIRLKRARKAFRLQTNKDCVKLCAGAVTGDSQPQEKEAVCVICYEEVDGFPTVQTFWPPCCARDAWFHRSCVQRMALSAGMHYLKCPLCNDKEQFYQAVVTQGYYVPDRDAAWELEQNAFAEIYERPSSCSADDCKCPMGRSHDADSGDWDIKLCLLCGTSGRHAGCLPAEPEASATRFVCATCTAVAPDQLDALAARIEAVISAEQRQSRQASRQLLMPSRMSLRRTKSRVAFNTPSTSQNDTSVNLGSDSPLPEMKREDSNDQSANTTLARLDLKLKTPRKLRSYETKPDTLKTIENSLLSPVKMLEENLSKRIACLGMQNVNPNMQDEVLLKVKEKLRKPRPLSEKKRIVNSFLTKLFQDILGESGKSKCTPKEIKEEITEVKGDINDLKADTTKLYSSGLAAKTPETVPTNAIDQNSEDHVENVDKGQEYDESSTSTFELPPEFIAERESDDSMNLFETPKKLRTVDIQKESSLEISENDEVVAIDVVKIENCEKNDFIKNLNLKNVHDDKSAFKSPLDEDNLKDKKLELDIESFKKYYLNEVVGEFKYNKKYDSEAESMEPLLGFDSTLQPSKTKHNKEKRRTLKRKIQTKDGVPEKKMKRNQGIVLRYKKNKAKNIKVVCSNENESMKSIDLTVESPKEKKKKKKAKNKNVRDNIHVKIRFRKEQLRLKITQNTKRNKKQKDKPGKNKLLTQYVLKYSENNMISKPEQEITQQKRKYVKTEKSPDNLVQMSISSFFKKVPSPESKI